MHKAHRLRSRMSDRILQAICKALLRMTRHALQSWDVRGAADPAMAAPGAARCVGMLARSVPICVEPCCLHFHTQCSHSTWLRHQVSG